MDLRRWCWEVGRRWRRRRCRSCRWRVRRGPALAELSWDGEVWVSTMDSLVLDAHQSNSISKIRIAAEHGSVANVFVDTVSCIMARGSGAHANKHVLVGGRREGGEASRSMDRNGRFGQRIRSASFPLTSTTPSKVRIPSSNVKLSPRSQGICQWTRSQGLAPSRRGENVGRNDVESVLGASNLTLVVAQIPHSDWSGSLRVERWPRSIWTINRSHPKARPRLLLRRLLCPSRHRVRVHLLFHPCLAFSFFDRIVTVKTSALSSVYPFLWLFFLAPSRIHA